MLMYWLHAMRASAVTALPANPFPLKLLACFLFLEVVLGIFFLGAEAQEGLHSGCISRTDTGRVLQSLTLRSRLIA
jgi:hypothetical protein